MDDLISRAEAVKAICGDCVWYNTASCEGEEWECDSVNKLRSLPADRPKDKWIPIKWHTITEEEREREGYPKEWVIYLDCEMPEDGQEIIVTTKHGYVEKDVCYLDDGYSLDSGWDWREDIVAWMPVPEKYREEVKIMTYEERIKKALKRMVAEHILTPLDAMTIEEYLIKYGEGGKQSEND